ncbi:hypothetical protein ElyMa_003528700 [Elysia marginata]|uniref:Uncharacterized protein n=1 Tax=Elysia marginata TaxID=1093978 RepID=A0AAV4EHZ9_9GAST|nr:hypothetical protein ElyMa_003528700 [Elysia marginata]
MGVRIRIQAVRTSTPGAAAAAGLRLLLLRRRLGQIEISIIGKSSLFSFPNAIDCSPRSYLYRFLIFVPSVLWVKLKQRAPNHTTLLASLATLRGLQSGDGEGGTFSSVAFEEGASCGGVSRSFSQGKAIIK